MNAGTWGILGSMLMAVVILGRIVALIARWFRTNTERHERDRRIAAQDAARALRRQEQLAAARPSEDTHIGPAAGT